MRRSMGTNKMQVILTPNLNPPYNLRRIHLAYGSKTLPTMTEQELTAYAIESCQKRGVIPADAPYWVVDVVDLPGGVLSEENDYFFDAWEWADGVQVNMPKATAIHLAEIRKVRNAELIKKDVAYIRAVETGDTAAQSSIAIEKQVLRDIPQTFALTARTPQQLKGKWPPELPPKGGNKMGQKVMYT